MKKIILLFLFCGPLFIACNNDEDDSSQEVNVSEKIVGQWHLNRREINGSLQDLEVCELSTNINFLPNSNFEIELFSGDDIDECQSANNTGLWEYLGSNEINIKLVTQDQPTLFRVSFSESFNKLVLIEYANGNIVQLEEYIRG